MNPAVTSGSLSPKAPAYSPAAVTTSSTYSAHPRPQHPNYLVVPSSSAFLPSAAPISRPLSAQSHQRHHFYNSSTSFISNDRRAFSETPRISSPMPSRSPDFTKNDILAVTAKMPSLEPKTADHDRKHRLGATALGPRSGGVQKRGRGGRSTALAAVTDLMPYHQYRARQRRDAAMGESVWDDELEAAFMEADRNIPNLGRTKLNVDGKLSGRNELIADYIFKLTGKRRTRKQVSSHIQVLKNLLKNNPDAMKNHGMHSGHEEHQEVARWDLEAVSPSAHSEPTHSPKSRAHPPGRPHTSMGYSDSHNLFGFVSPPPSASGSHFGFPQRNVELSKFAMIKTNPAGRINGGFHTFTCLIQEAPARSVSLSSIPSWQTRFPRVAEITRDEATTCALLGGNCTFLHIQSSVSVMVPEEAPAEGRLHTQIDTQVEISLPDDVYEGFQWDCVTRIYAPGKKAPVWDVTHECCQVVEDPVRASRKLVLPFASEFWGAFYDGLFGAHSEHGSSGGFRTEQEVDMALRGLTVVQELFSVHGSGAKERSAVLMWEFTKADSGWPGTAVWREVIRQSGRATIATVCADTDSAAGREFYGLLGVDTAVANNGWATQQQHSHYPISPYEEQSPSHAPRLTGYYPYEEPHGYPTQSMAGLDGPMIQGTAPAIKVDMDCFPSDQTDVGYALYPVDIPSATDGAFDYLHGNDDGSHPNSRVGGYGTWPHLSPASDGHGHEALDGSGTLVSY